jgi:hypothetical protein
MRATKGNEVFPTSGHSASNHGPAQAVSTGFILVIFYTTPLDGMALAIPGHGQQMPRCFLIIF